MDQPDYEQPQTGMRSHRRQGDHAAGASRTPEPAKDKPMPRAKKRLLILLAIVIGTLLILGAILYWLPARQFQNTNDAFIDRHVSQIAPQIAGRIVALKVHDNEEVHPGQLLAEIDPRDYEVRLTQAVGRRKQAAAQVLLERAGIGQAQANVRVAEADDDRARRDLKRFRHIDPKAISRWK